MRWFSLDLCLKLLRIVTRRSETETLCYSAGYAGRSGYLLISKMWRLNGSDTFKS